MHCNDYPKGNVQKMKMSRFNLALGFLCLAIAVICLVIILFPNMEEMLLSFAKSHAPRVLTDAEESIFKKAIIFFPVIGIILSILVGILTLFEKSIITSITRNIIIVSYLAVTLIAIVIRLPGLQFLTVDYEYGIKPWISHLASNSHLLGINSIHSMYTPFYLFILGFISFLPDSLWLISVKFVSCLFDFFLAIICGKIVFSVSDRRERALVAYSAILLCPTVFFNSSIWAQSDSIYVAFMFLSLLLFIKGKNNPALFIYGIALSIKLQAIFMLPFIIILYLYNKYKIGNIIFLLLGFISTCIIGLPFGAPLQLIKAFYIQLTTFSSQLTWNAPSIYALFHIRNESIPLIQNIGIIITLGVLVCFALYILYSNRNHGQGTEYSDVSLDKIQYVIIFFFFTLIIPFLLPKVHERYFYAAEAASIIFAVLFPRKWWITLLIILPACATYFNFLFANTANLFPLAIIMLFAVLLVTKWTIASIGKTDSGINYDSR
ncbi:MAG: hypothetical protein LBQ94_01015 [Treponema sp.]|jgi:Gpi18-like mannosyltransferase|nr:hypothetical protein [Treponema sp.]